MAEAVVFDMDGIIIDSESLWRIAMVKVFNASGLPVDEVACAQTTGMRIDEVIKHWNKEHPFTNDELKVQLHIEEELCELIRNEGKAMPGFMKAIELIKKQGKKVALATSSSERLINCVLDTLSVRNYFRHAQSAQDLAYGKPHPEVFLRSAEALGVLPMHCIAIEDSLNGIISAKSATMKVVAVPEPHNISNPKFAIADVIIPSLDDFTLSLMQKF
jgi:HAD superfamily hydrolase (TIGR01509 family)